MDNLYPTREQNVEMERVESIAPKSWRHAKNRYRWHSVADINAWRFNGIYWWCVVLHVKTELYAYPDYHWVIVRFISAPGHMVICYTLPQCDPVEKTSVWHFE